MSETIARVTIRLDVPLTGAEIAQAVKDTVVSRNTESFPTKFVEEVNYIDGYAVRVGQGGHYANQHILVTVPNTESDLIFLDKSYRQILVMNHSWATNGEFISATLTIETVRRFAQDLQERFKSMPRSDHPPQYPGLNLI